MSPKAVVPAVMADVLQWNGVCGAASDDREGKIYECDGRDLPRGALIVIVLGALMMAESVVNMVTGTTLFFDGIGRPFEFVVGLIVIVFGATFIPSLK